jgi:hypothetical protein
MAAVLGWGVAHIDVMDRPDLGRGGLCLRSRDPFKALSEDDLEKPSDSDYTQAVRLASLLAPQPGWRATLRTVRDLTRRTEVLVEGSWIYISVLAGELERRGSMDGKEIAEYLPLATTLRPA